MALFHFGKKKEEKKTPVCACSSSDNTRVESDAPCCPEAENRICCIKVLGAGCKSCHEQYEQAQQAAGAQGAGPDMSGAAGAAQDNGGDDVVDGDYREV